MAEYILSLSFSLSLSFIYFSCLGKNKILIYKHLFNKVNCIQSYEMSNFYGKKVIKLLVPLFPIPTQSK